MNRYLIILMISFISVIPNLSMAYANSDLKNVPVTRLLEKIPANAITIETTFESDPIRDYILCENDGFGRKVIIKPYDLSGGAIIYGGGVQEAHIFCELSFLSNDNKVIGKFKLPPNFNRRREHKTYYYSNELLLNNIPSKDAVKTKFQLKIDFGSPTIYFKLSSWEEIPAKKKLQRVQKPV